MLPRHAPWAVAAVCLMIVATAGAASYATPAFASVEVQARASASHTEAAAETGAEIPASSPGPAPRGSSPHPRHGPSANGTPPGNHTPPANNTTVPPHLAPREQWVVNNSSRAEFGLVVRNPARVAQEVGLQAFTNHAQPAVGWNIQLSPPIVMLGPGESRRIHGSVEAPTPLGGIMDLTVYAFGEDGYDTAHVVACLRSIVQRCEASGATNETNGTRPPTNETPPRNETPPPPPTNNTTAIPAPRLAPREQWVTSNTTNTSRVEFRLVVTNPARVAQTVIIGTSAPDGWFVAVSPAEVTLAPGESARLHGSIDGPVVIGGQGTVVVHAWGASATDRAQVHACFRSLVQKCPTTPTNDTPPGNHTPPPSPGGNSTSPPANGTSNGAQEPSYGGAPACCGAPAIPSSAPAREAEVAASGRAQEEEVGPAAQVGV